MYLSNAPAEVVTPSESRNQGLPEEISLTPNKNFMPHMIMIIMGIFLSAQVLFFFSFPQSIPNQMILILNLVFNASAAVLACLVAVKMSKLNSKKLKEDLELAAKMSIEMRRIKKEWEKTFDSMFDWVSIIDKNQTIIRSNRCSEKLVGVRPEQIIGKKCCTILHGTDGPVLGCPFNEMIENRKRASTEIVSKDGKWVMISIDPIFDEQGDIISAVHIVRDISIRKSYEIERERLIEKLKRADHKIKILSGLVPICSFCKKIRDESGHWELLEDFIQDRSEATFSHSVCPNCFRENYPDLCVEETDF